MPIFPNVTIPASRESNSFANLRFPLDIGPIGMRIKFKKFNYNELNKGFSAVGRDQTAIVLPIPQNIQDNQGISIDASQLGLTGALTAEMISSLEGGLGGVTETIASTYRQGMGLAEAAGAALAGDGSFDYTSSQFLRAAAYLGRRGLDNFAPGAGLGIEQATGTAVNPHASLNFDGVPLKEFQFNWTLSPKNEKESDVLRDIEKKIKQHILPGYSGLTGDGNSADALERAFLAYPDICEIQFVGIDPSYYFNFKPGMVSNFSINYSPQGNVILKGGKPAIVSISMTFKEARIHVREDYGGQSGGVVSAPSNPEGTAPEPEQPSNGSTSGTDPTSDSVFV